MSARVFPELNEAPSLISETPASRRRDYFGTIVAGAKRRWLRERRRRKVGRAYDMALEISRVIPRGSEVLDVGCGNGYIAHHLKAMLGTNILGIDLSESTEAPIYYRQYDGKRYPLPDDSFDAIVSAYVLHHAQDARSVLNEMKRVLRPGGLAVIYEDIPATKWDRFVCSIHNRQWRNRTGVCTFCTKPQWRVLFELYGFETISERSLSRWRNLAHSVTRVRFVLGSVK